MAQNLNTNTSIVDFLKSQGQDSSMEARASLAEQQGITGYQGTAEQNTQLLQSLQGMQSPQGGQGQTPLIQGSSPSNLINDPQDQEMSLLEQADGPQMRGQETPSMTDFYGDLSSAINQAVGPRPQPISLAQSFQQLRESTGVANLETTMNQLRDEQRQVEAFREQRINQERGRRQRGSVIAGRVGEIERQENERLDQVMRQQAYINDQLNTSYNVINTMMGFMQQDYQNAVQSYDSQFSQIMTTMDAARGLRRDAISDQQREEDIARANLQIMYNSLVDGSADFDQLDSGVIATLTKLEAQSGLPTGFYKALQARAGQSDIVSTTNREVDGVRFVDMVMRDRDGGLYVESVRIGAVGGGAGGTGGASGTGAESRRLPFEDWVQTPEAAQLVDEEQNRRRQSMTEDARMVFLRSKYDNLPPENIQFESMQNLTPARRSSLEAANLLNAPANVQAFYDAAPNNFKQFYQQAVALGEIDFTPTVQELAEMQEEFERLRNQASNQRSLGI